MLLTIEASDSGEYDRDHLLASYVASVSSLAFAGFVHYTETEKVIDRPLTKGLLITGAFGLLISILTHAIARPEPNEIDIEPGAARLGLNAHGIISF